MNDTHRHTGSSGDGNKVKLQAIEGLLGFIQNVVTSEPVGLQYQVDRIDPSFDSGDESYTVGFQPKCLIMFGFGHNGFTGIDENYFSYGFADGTNNYCLSKNYNTAISPAVVIQDIRNYLVSNGVDSTHYARLTLKSFDTNGFTTTAETLNDPADGRSVSLGRYTYLAIG